MIEVLLAVLLLVASIVVVYAVIRLAVRDGMADAERLIDARRVRESQGAGAERSPNSRQD